MRDFWTSISIRTTISPLERYISMSLIKKDMVIIWEKLFKVIFFFTLWDNSPFSLHKRRDQLEQAASCCTALLLSPFQKMWAYSCNVWLLGLRKGKPEKGPGSFFLAFYSLNSFCVEKLVYGPKVSCAYLLWYCFVVVPHITDAVQEWVMNQAKVPVDDDKKEPQICVIEVSMESFRLYIYSEHNELVCFLFAPYYKNIRLKFYGEQKFQDLFSIFWFALKWIGMVLSLQLPFTSLNPL